MDTEKLRSWQSWIRTELESSVNFWLKNGMDPEHGGIYTCLTREGKVFSTDKSVWMQGRCGWIFAHMCRLYGTRPEWLEASRSCLDFMEDHCINRSAGNRMYFTVTADGKPLRQRRYCFSEEFYAIANAEYYGITGDRKCLERARRAYQLVYDLNHGAPDPTGLGPKTIPETRKGRALADPMIFLNMTSVLRRVDPEQAALYDQYSAQCVHDIFAYHHKPDLHCTLESVGMNGEFQSDISAGRVVNPGHDIECSWFLMEEANRIGSRDLHRKAEDVFRFAINAGWDQEYGGLLYFIDCMGLPPEAYEHRQPHGLPRHPGRNLSGLVLQNHRLLPRPLRRPCIRGVVWIPAPGRQTHAACLQGKHLQGPVPRAPQPFHGGQAHRRDSRSIKRRTGYAPYPTAAIG